MRHLMSYASFDVEWRIWHQYTTYVDFAHLGVQGMSGSQQRHLWLQNCLKIQKLKSGFGIFFIYTFWKSFVFYLRPHFIFILKLSRRCYYEYHSNVVYPLLTGVFFKFMKVKLIRWLFLLKIYFRQYNLIQTSGSISCVCHVWYIVQLTNATPSTQ
jgi:hypothetical protein